MSAKKPTERNTRRNILLIVVDQWRGDTLEHIGHPVVKTPNLSRLAARGVTFANHYGQGAPCGPSRASLLTGTYVMTHRVVRNGTPLDSILTTLPREVARGGYDPALVGYTTTTPDPRFGVSTDDPRYESHGDIMADWRHIRTFAPNKRPYWSYLKANGFEVPVPPEQSWNPEPGTISPTGRLNIPSRIAAGNSDSSWFTEAALGWIDANPDRPWFLHYGLYRPHPPFIVAKEYLDLYDPDLMPAPVRAETVEAEAAQHPLLALYMDKTRQEGFFENRSGATCTMTVDEVKQARAQYYGLITEADHNIGLVLDRLEATGEIDNTLIVLTSDHGEQLGNHYQFGKQGYFIDNFHVPMIVVDPSSSADATRGHVETAFTESIDVMPTILEWMDQPIPRQCTGGSLLPFLAGQRPDGWRNEVFYEFDFREVRDPAIEQHLGNSMDECALAAIQTEQWKYVHFANLPPLLFDLKNDPAELHNLANDSSRVAIMLDLAQRLISWRISHADRTLTGYCAHHGLNHRDPRDMQSVTAT